ncbi:MAG: hypothetical protein KME26_03730 [Oscillatoria princeps RMCB-10]|nr:hypothetical protein [Oscillatoria princeps RMCB-10]
MSISVSLLSQDSRSLAAGARSADTSHIQSAQLPAINFSSTPVPHRQLLASRMPDAASHGYQSKSLS